MVMSVSPRAARSARATGTIHLAVDAGRSLLHHAGISISVVARELQRLLLKTRRPWFNCLKG